MSAIAQERRARVLADDFIAFLESGEVPDGLFAPDVFCDFTLPHWRLQADDVAGLVALRRRGHPGPSRVIRSRFDETPAGFVLEFEERWEDTSGTWYCRELARADVGDAGITQLSIYCTGDWSAAREEEHRSTVRLIRP
ncbi:MAG: hypothetical protein WAU41_17780 [Gaiellaceae bacterium]